MGVIDLWKQARKSAYSGDLAVALSVASLLRIVPKWAGVWQPSIVEAVALGVGVGLLSMSFDLLPERDDALRRGKKSE